VLELLDLDVLEASSFDLDTFLAKVDVFEAPLPFQSKARYVKSSN